MDREREKLDFWAHLASSYPLTIRKLPTEEKATLVKNFKRIFLPWFDDPVAAQQFFDEKLSPQIKEEIEGDYKAGRLEARLEMTLQNLLWDGAKLISDLLDGEKVAPPTWAMPQQPVWILVDGKLQVQSVDLKTRQYREFSTHLSRELLSDLIPTLQRKPFPFRRCRMCPKVMVQAERGKPRFYCSEACRSKGIPFAAKRTEYSRERRHQKRREDIATVQRILQAWPEGDYWNALHKMFPGKSRMALVRLVNKAKEVSRGKKG